jgi:hypothetical protein
VSGSIVRWLADGAPRNTGPDFGKASPVGLLIIVLLLICTGFLVASMNRHLKKLPDRFNRKPDSEPDQTGDDDGTVGRQDASADTGSAETTSDNGSPPHEPGG